MAPTVPANLVATAISETAIDLTWDASTDTGTGVAGYNIYRDGNLTPIATVTGTTYSDTGLAAETLYSYQVSAVDAAATPVVGVVRGCISHHPGRGGYGGAHGTGELGSDRHQ